MNLRHSIFFVFCLLIGNTFAQQKKFTLVPSSESGVSFRNDIIEDPNMFLYLYENLYMGGGVSIGDINNDGLSDIYFSSTRGYNKYFIVPVSYVSF